MVSELQKLRNSLHTYQYANEETKAFADAKAHLEYVHEKYGTTDPNLIADLIK
jgi:hypothetical protein